MGDKAYELHIAAVPVMPGVDSIAGTSSDTSKKFRLVLLISIYCNC